MVTLCLRSSKLKFEIFQGGDAYWYWHMKARNGRIIAIGGEGYTTLEALVRTFGKIFFYTSHGLNAREAVAKAREARKQIRSQK